MLLFLKVYISREDIIQFSKSQCHVEVVASGQMLAFQ